MAANKAQELLKTNVSVAQRADKFAVSIQRNIQKDVLDVLVDRKDKIDEELFELSDFSLETDVNRGVRPMKQEECEERFKKMIELEYELELLEKEIEIKTKSFNKYFGINEPAKKPAKPKA